MKLRKYFLITLLICTSAFSSTRTVEFVVPYAPGGAADKFAQTILPVLKNELSKEDLLPVISYRPGAGSVIGISSVAKSDQLQLVITSNSVITAPVFNKLQNSYNVAEDLEVVAYLGNIPLVMVTNPASGINNFADLASRCKNKNFSYATGGPGTASHIGPAIVFSQLKCNPIQVPYKGLGPMLASLMGNHSSVATDFVSGVKGLIDDRKLIPLLVLDRNRLGAFPGVPSLTDVGMADSRLDNWFVIMVNRSANAQQLTQVRRAVAAAINTPDLVQQLQSMGLHGTGNKKSNNFLVDEQRNFERILKVIKIDE